MKVSQESVVLTHLDEHGSITSWEAWERYGMTRLSSVIHKLRHGIHDGKCYPIETETVSSNGKSFAKYSLEKGQGRLF